MARLLTAIVLLLSGSVSAADNIDVLVGEWTSPDGTLKQRIARTFDGGLLETQMWFRKESQWKLVSQGSGYRRPGETAWRLVSRTIEMDGIELFESTLEPISALTFKVVNIAYRGDGSAMETEEEWSFVDENRYTYTIFKIEGGERLPWYEGEWIRLGGAD